MAKRPITKPNATLTLPADLRGDASDRLARRVIYVLVATVAGLLIWAAFAPVEEVAVASGHIVPASSVSDVNHLEGGIVEAVLVKEGQHVTAGEPLVRLRPQQASSDLLQLEVRAANLQLKEIRLTASLASKAPDFGALGQRYPRIAAEQKHAFEQFATQTGEQQKALELEINRVRDQIASTERESASLKLQMGIQTDQALIREKSNAQGYTTQILMLQARANLEETRQHIIAVNGKIADQNSLLEEARAKLRGVAADRQQKLSEERSEVVAQLSEIDETLGKFRDRVDRLDVVSPVAGVVQSLVYKVTGEVIKPGALVAQIVPGAGGIVAEVELKPQDIGHVSAGNSAEIKLSNYDPNVVGVIRGQVQLISATTFEDKQGRPFYRARIVLDRDILPVREQNLLILPGMTLEARILTGSKSLMRYMLKPVYQSFDTAFSER